MAAGRDIDVSEVAWLVTWRRRQACRPTAMEGMSRETERATARRYTPPGGVMLLLGMTLWCVSLEDSVLTNRQILASESPTLESVLTYHLVHTNLLHLVLNMVLLLLVGGSVETRWGTPRFLLFYLTVSVAVAGVTVALGQLAMLTGFVHDATPRGYGASGTVLACLAVLALFPAKDRPCAAILTRELIWGAILFGAAGLALLDLLGTKSGVFLLPQVSAVGVALGFFWLDGWCRDRVRRIRDCRREKGWERIAQIRQRVDLLLGKIGTQGMDSLTSEERLFLKHASKHFRNAPD